MSTVVKAPELQFRWYCAQIIEGGLAGGDAGIGQGRYCPQT